jgi:hypothetical protein
MISNLIALSLLFPYKKAPQATDTFSDPIVPKHRFSFSSTIFRTDGLTLGLSDPNDGHVY